MELRRRLHVDVYDSLQGVASFATNGAFGRDYDRRSALDLRNRT